MIVFLWTEENLPTYLDPNIQGMQKTYRGVGHNDAKKTTKKSKKGLNSIPIGQQKSKQ